MQFVLGNQGLQWSDAWFLLHGAWNTILVTALAGFLGTILGIVLGWARASSKAVRFVTLAYIDVIRSVPLIIQLVLLNSFLSLSGYPLDAFWIGTLVLASSMAVLTSEVVRSALNAVPPNYRRAGRSLGMTYAQELVHISAPLATRTGLAPWIGLLISLTKDSALISVVGYLEFLRSSQVLITRTHETLLIFGGVGLFYFCICYPISRYSRHLEKRIAV
jgi:His/Glu/Gln/Arg/opine family amino acid ABC transporter permease subunit